MSSSHKENVSLYSVIFPHMFKGIFIFSFLNFLLLVFPLVSGSQYNWPIVAVFFIIQDEKISDLQYPVIKINLDFSDNVPA